MKVAYNSCYGGFGLSALALEELAKKKGVSPEGYYPSFYDDEARADPDLIEIIERLGSKANGSCAQLEIAEIPNGADFEIDEYDGNESVVPPRQRW
jgi:uncharacterized protein (UPF0210 family)